MESRQGSLFTNQEQAPPQTLEELYAEIDGRIRSSPLYDGRAVILGQGRPGARVAVVGESPGPPDISSGIPFTGPAGEMLDRMLSAIGLNRKDCYLTNTIKVVCTGEEITKDMLSFFAPFLFRELAIVRPGLILSLGNTPTRCLLRTKKPISELRGELHEVEGMQLLPTFNPAYLLRDPAKKREAWEDMKRARTELLKLTQRPG
jgi:uracil-DNA glycosylase family 4